ncbi:LytR/AlgR family response regulator transcription factor [Rubrivirga marina]|uniref:DNA-binding response regulator n=1 Tax=Rubrivirga marina TaxID=1196024 RepID=A0A271J1D0_9BACT|nr:LytTR family DNA-binding domain-containing protein [Rubrivirga marina]PAP77316.1 DNA-binding response regulator [Rubrivirga marina]
MSSLRVLIVDDESPARSRLRRLLDPFVEAGRLGPVDEAADGVEAVETLSETDYDLAFLDVRMPELDGFGVIERIPPGRRPDVVFTTAYDEYAIQAFEANATDYLLKPINAERLEKAVSRVEDRRDEDPDARLADLLDTLDEVVPTPAADGPPIERFTVQGRDRLLVVEAAEVIAAEVHDGITSLYVVSEGKTAQRHIVSFTLDALESRLDPDLFMRVHRNALVNLSAIREMIPWFSGRYKLVLTTGHEVTASRARSRELRSRLAL